MTNLFLTLRRSEVKVSSRWWINQNLSKTHFNTVWNLDFWGKKCLLSKNTNLVDGFSFQFSSIERSKTQTKFSFYRKNRSDSQLSSQFFSMHSLTAKRMTKFNIRQLRFFLHLKIFIWKIEDRLSFFLHFVGRVYSV